MTNFFVAIAYNKVVIMYQKYSITFSDERFTMFVTNVFPKTYVLHTIHIT